MEKLENDGANLSTIEDNEDNVLACMNEMVDEMYRNQLKTNNDFNLDGLKIDVDFDDDIIQRIDKVLSRSAELVPANIQAMDGSSR